MQQDDDVPAYGSGPSRRTLLASGTALAFGLTALGASRKARAASVPATKPDKIIVRTWGDPWQSTLQKAVSEKFTAETGIKVAYDLTDFGPMQVKIQQALKAGNRPPCDVNHTVAYFAARAVAQRLVQKLDPEIVTNETQLTAVGLSSGSSAGYFVSPYSYIYPIIYNSDLIQPPEDMSWEGILDPKYGKSFFGGGTFDELIMPFAKIKGIDVATGDLTPVWAEIAKLKPNLTGLGQDSDFVNSMKSKQSKWGTFIVGNGIDLKNGGLPIKWFVPREGSTMCTDSLYVPRGLPDNVNYYAQKYINQWIDAASLTAYCEAVGTVPTNKGSTPAKYMLNDPVFPFTEEQIHKYALPMPMDATARNQDKWQAAYMMALQG
ncbi:extracellular solute-binding protein [Acidisoma cellulosilytica]|uniref:Extracellular solute-binding protein n=1 Tax=Acidisoma cellulosilyticum TaxID=2802395 RepID=A0A963Z7P9_9PROT|nr:extracellular solute-binding protein [Acidisoma cellulosilyticum]MCB8883373.1 extracellular solute-binding protein [Acidisoma cellulosilyticum]